MTVDEQVALLVRRQIVQIKEMSMRDERGAPVQIKERVIRHNRELENHLIDLGVAVAADTEQLVPYAVEKRNNALRVIFIRQIVARTVVEQVAQQDKTLGFFLLILTQNGFAGTAGTVDIGSKHQFHMKHTFLLYLKSSSSRGIVFAMQVGN